MKVTLRHPTRVVEVSDVRRVRLLLDHLRINPDTVLVIRGGDLLTREESLAEGDEIEIRPVISGGAGTPVALCKRCRAPAKVEVARANAAFCADCFVLFVRRQATKAIEDHRMLSPAAGVLVGVSGGKDSLALWDVLLDLGYDAVGYHIVLRTEEEYSRASREACERFAAARGARLIIRDLREHSGLAIEEVARERRRPPCSVCGLAKRYLLNLGAIEGGFETLATGHNLDDEAATLLGNTLHWSLEFIARQMPVLPPTHPRLARKVKPFYRLAERETAAYAVLRGIDYVVDECPLVAGSTALRYKEALNVLEAQSPGTKQQFVFGFLQRAAALFAASDPVVLRECARCGMPTTADVCAYCKAVASPRDADPIALSGIPA